MVEALIAYGHSEERVWRMTPRVAAGWLWFAWRRKRNEAAEALHIATLGARGELKEVNDLIKRWGRQ